MFLTCPSVRCERNVLNTDFDANCHKLSAGQGHETINFGG